MKTRTIILVASCLFALTNISNAVTQSVTSQTTKYDLAAGETFDVTLNYETDTPNLTGIGISLIFDSSKLSFEGFTQTLQQSFIASDATAQNDSQNSDQNTETDKLAKIAWASISADWPGTTSTALATAHFKAKEAINNHNTVIQIHTDGAANSSVSNSAIQVAVSSLSNNPSSPDNNSGSSGGGSLPWFFLITFLLLKPLSSLVNIKKLEKDETS